MEQTQVEESFSLLIFFLLSANWPLCTLATHPGLTERVAFTSELHDLPGWILSELILSLHPKLKILQGENQICLGEVSTTILLINYRHLRGTEKGLRGFWTEQGEMCRKKFLAFLSRYESQYLFSI